MTPPVKYVEPPDIPEGLTVAEYRRRRRAEREADCGRIMRLRRALKASRAAARAGRAPDPPV